MDKVKLKSQYEKQNYKITTFKSLSETGDRKLSILSERKQNFKKQNWTRDALISTFWVFGRSLYTDGILYNYTVVVLRQHVDLFGASWNIRIIFFSIIFIDNFFFDNFFCHDLEIFSQFFTEIFLMWILDSNVLQRQQKQEAWNENEQNLSNFSWTVFSTFLWLVSPARRTLKVETRGLTAK